MVWRPTQPCLPFGLFCVSLEGWSSHSQLMKLATPGPSVSAFFKSHTHTPWFVYFLFYLGKIKYFLNNIPMHLWVFVLAMRTENGLIWMITVIQIRESVSRGLLGELHYLLSAERERGTLVVNSLKYFNKSCLCFQWENKTEGVFSSASSLLFFYFKQKLLFAASNDFILTLTH